MSEDDISKHHQITVSIFFLPSSMQHQVMLSNNLEVSLMHQKLSYHVNTSVVNFSSSLSLLTLTGQFTQMG